MRFTVGGAQGFRIYIGQAQPMPPSGNGDTSMARHASHVRSTAPVSYTADSDFHRAA